MAGIGFRLQKLLSEDSYSASLRAYAYSALIAAGPFLLTVLVICLVQWAAFDRLSADERSYLQALITCAYAFSLLAVGPFHLVVTRWAADEYYRGRTRDFTGAFVSCFAASALVSLPAALLWLRGLSAPPQAKAATLLLGLCALGTWIALVFLSAAKDYKSIARAFLAGAALSAGAAALLGGRTGMGGYLAGFACGQALTLLILAAAVVREFGRGRALEIEWLRYFARHPRLAAIGFLYNAGIWADKVVFWLSAEGRELDRGLRYAPVYDSPMFFAYLSVLPALAYFLFRMETDFFLRYQAYYGAIQAQEPLSTLEERRRSITEGLAESITDLLVLQGAVSGAVLLQVPRIVEFLRMDPLQMGVLRIGLFAAFLQAAFLIVLNLLMYFDLQKDALRSAALFFLANAGLTWASLRGDMAAYGYGYALACLLALGTAFYLLNERLGMLHYWTFMKQPMPRPVPPAEDD